MMEHRVVIGLSAVGFRAICSCGWASERDWPRAAVVAASAEHKKSEHARQAAKSTEPPIHNPYLDAFFAPTSDAERALLPLPLQSDLIAEYDDFLKWLRRNRLVNAYAWAIPTEAVIRTIARRSPICDMGCGTGYWAHLLEQAGARVLAVDPTPPTDNENHWHRAKTRSSQELVELRHYVAITRGDAETFDVPADHTLLLCWPPYGQPMAEVALARYRGDCVIYIGEKGGCTATDAFHEALTAEWNLVEEHDIPQWSGIHDAVYVYERRDTR